MTGLVRDGRSFDDFQKKLKMKTAFKMRKNIQDDWETWIKRKIDTCKYLMDELDKEIEDKKANASKRELTLFKAEIQEAYDDYWLATVLAKEWNGK